MDLGDQFLFSHYFLSSLLFIVSAYLIVYASVFIVLSASPMAPNHHLFLLIFFLTTLFLAINPIATVTASPSPPPPPPHSRPSPSTTPQQLNNIIDVLIRAGNFGNWVNIITGANPLVFPLSATLFISQDNALNSLPTTTVAATVALVLG
ncbi:FAS1 domain-containing protein [Pyrus ussuriensis x Pyrus communis]|uniref:FAS1 domain-containing protein n=1 Tax=Pyrus ussuriensis x Pyrus communis TaxID=2448454 RepID=A0A5N5FRD4_9ROSA|nr:FAS1 domain-containing protein [Pyrus ussuriensis x Pyrus communis]